MKNLTIILMAISSLLGTGCFWVTTKHEGETLRKDLTKVTKRVQVQEEHLGESVNKLKKTLDEASQLLARNSADLGAQFSGLTQENARLAGLVMEAKRYADEIKEQMTQTAARIDNLEARLMAVEGKTASKPQQTAEELYAAGMTAFKGKSYDEARELFRTLVIRYPGHQQADSAQFHRGESFFLQKNYEAALPEYQSVFEKFAGSALADDALFRAGESAESLKWCTDARAYFGLLRQKYPRSDLADKAKNKDATLKKNAKNKKYCKS